MLNRWVTFLLAGIEQNVQMDRCRLNALRDLLCMFLFDLVVLIQTLGCERCSPVIVHFLKRLESTALWCNLKFEHRWQIIAFEWLVFGDQSFSNCSVQWEATEAQAKCRTSGPVSDLDPPELGWESDYFWDTDLNLQGKPWEELFLIIYSCNRG